MYVYMYVDRAREVASGLRIDFVCGNDWFSFVRFSYSHVHYISQSTRFLFYTAMRKKKKIKKKQLQDRDNLEALLIGASSYCRGSSGEFGNQLWGYRNLLARVLGRYDRSWSYQ